MMTSQETADNTDEIKKGWTSYRDIKIKKRQPENIILNKCLSLFSIKGRDDYPTSIVVS